MSVDEHVKLVNKFFPGYILDYKVYKGCIWIDYKIIKGIPATEVFPKTAEFIKKVYRFCVDSYKKTAPFFHGDCGLDNILVDGDDFYLIDWDSCDRYSEEEVYEDLYEDLIKENIMEILCSSDGSKTEEAYEDLYEDLMRQYKKTSNL